eukprot:5747073-Lingulodinium_polyedra.AAC.1
MSPGLGPALVALCEGSVFCKCILRRLLASYRRQNRSCTDTVVETKATSFCHVISTVFRSHASPA